MDESWYSIVNHNQISNNTDFGLALYNVHNCHISLNNFENNNIEGQSNGETQAASMSYSENI